jgi:hypothetical protein
MKAIIVKDNRMYVRNESNGKPIYIGKQPLEDTAEFDRFVDELNRGVFDEDLR